MKFITVLAALLLSFSHYAQKQDYKGYYVTDTGVKKEGYFKFGDFSNPDVLEFKISESGEYSKIETYNLKEYGIYDQYKYEKHDVKVDIIKALGDKSYAKDPEWEIKTMFLSCILEGDASLYAGTVNGEKRFFYSVLSKDIEPTQLVYRRYVDNNKLKENNAFRQELFNFVRCQNDSGEDFKVSYSENSLKKIITRFNDCQGVSQKEYSNKGGEKFMVKYSLGAGATLNSLKLDADGNTDTDNAVGFSISGEIVVVPPSSTLAAFLRLEYNNVNAKVMAPVDFNERMLNEGEIKGGFFSVLLGPRIYLGKEKHKKGLFLDAGPGIAFSTGEFIASRYSFVDGEPILTGDSEDASSVEVFLGLGIGYAITKNAGFDLRYETPKKLIESGEYKLGKASLNLRYTFN